MDPLDKENIENGGLELKEHRAFCSYLGHSDFNASITLYISATVYVGAGNFDAVFAHLRWQDVGCCFFWFFFGF